jgi:hypothetical protein
MTQLSPQAQAVLDAHQSTSVRPVATAQIAAALQVVADQVVPVEPEPPELPFADVNDPWPSWNANQETRKKLLAIANELKTS